MQDITSILALCTGIVGLVTAVVSAISSHRKVTRMRTELRNGTTERLNSLESTVNTALDLMKEDRMRTAYKLEQIREDVRVHVSDLRDHFDAMSRARERRIESQE